MIIINSHFRANPNDPELFYLRAVCHHHTLQFTESASGCKEAISLLGQKNLIASAINFPVHNLYATYASCLFQLGHYTEASENYNIALSCLNISHSKNNKAQQGEMLFGLGRSLLFEGRSEEAMQKLGEAVKIWPPITEKLEDLQQQLSRLQ